MRLIVPDACEVERILAEPKKNPVPDVINHCGRIKSFFTRIIVFLLLIMNINGQQIKVVTNNESKMDPSLNYLFFLPDSYNDNTKTKWPLILFLHGMGERGDDINLIKIHGIPKIVEKDKSFPFIAISPQCPLNSDWRNPEIQNSVVDMLENILEKYRVDKDRVYITGLSMGGFGTWAIAAKRPDLFAAAAPICGGGDPANAKVLRRMPIWVFHGANDEIVLVQESEKMVRAIRQFNGNVRYTLYPNAGHDSWTETYESKELYDWFLSNNRINK